MGARTCLGQGPKARIHHKNEPEIYQWYGSLRLILKAR